jgi:anti-sigma regulatory factor (Ser/Thr protein kinase)
MSQAAGYALDQPLPAAAVVGGLQGWFGYRRFPAFSLAWLGRRGLLFALPIGGLSALTLLGGWSSSGDLAQSLQSAGYLLLSLSLMCFAGPLLASVIRYRRWPQPRERVGVVLAVLLGMGVSYAIDSWASARLQPVIDAQRGDAASAAAKPATPPGPIAIAARLGTLAAVYFMLGGGLALRGYFSEQRRVAESLRAAELGALRQQSQRSELQLSLLQAQVEPHFLFNTLASIRALLRQDVGLAEQTLDALVAHLRACMPRLNGEAGDTVSTVGQQLEICRSYLELMQLRLGDRLRFRIDCAPALSELPFLPLLLITLVENAVKHGIEPKPGPGEITLQVERVSDDRGAVLVARVEDNGIGLRPGQGSGVGLANIRGQLSHCYAGRARLSIAARAAGGVRAELRIPLDEAAS